MIKQEAIVTVLTISCIGERKYFQVALPEDTKRIIGLEYAVMGKDGEALPDPFPVGNSFAVLPDRTIGHLTLQVAGRENLFYRGALTEDRTIHTGEGIDAVLWQPRVWTHDRKREELAVSVSSDTTLIEGYFIDTCDTSEYSAIQYLLHLYLWIEKC